MTLGLVLLFVAGAGVACAGAGPRVQTGNDAVRTPDGLHMVDGVRVGKLFMKPNYAFGSYESFILGPTQASYVQSARMLDPSEGDRLTAIFERVAQQAIVGTGRTQVSSPSPCVALINLFLIDVDIAMTGETAGAATLLLEVRDSVTNEPLLRYGQRRKIRGVDLETAFRRFSLNFQRDFNRALPLEEPPDALGCEERARLGSVAADAE